MACAGQLGCLKCELDGIVSRLGAQLAFDEIFHGREGKRLRQAFNIKKQTRFQRKIVVSALHLVVSSILSLSPSFALTSASSDAKCLQGVAVTGLFDCCVVVQEEMGELYDQRITDEHTGRKLLNWAIATAHEATYDHRTFDFVTTGTHHCCQAALKLVEQGRHCRLGRWL